MGFDLRGSFSTQLSPLCYSLRLLVRTSSEEWVHSLCIIRTPPHLCGVCYWTMASVYVMRVPDCFVVSCTFLRTVLYVGVMFIFCIYRHSHLTRERNPPTPFEQCSIISKERQSPCELIANGGRNGIDHTEKETSLGCGVSSFNPNTRVEAGWALGYSRKRLKRRKILNCVF